VEELIKVIILGIVEGITEFLPISSTGHLIVFTNLLNAEIARLGGTFEIFIQFGAVIAVLIFYFGDIRTQILTVHKDPVVQRLWRNIIIASIPLAITGFLFRDAIKEIFFNPLTIAIALIIGGIIFILIERNPKPTTPDQTLDTITLKQAAIIGVFQTIALIPGVSRSGITIIVGLLGGINRAVITQFTFYLAIPVLGGATLIDLILSLDELNGNDMLYLIIGAIVAGVVAWLSIRWLLTYVSKNSFMVFGYYRIMAGIVILILLGANVL